MVRANKAFHGFGLRVFGFRVQGLGVVRFWYLSGSRHLRGNLGIRQALGGSDLGLRVSGGGGRGLGHWSLH